MKMEINFINIKSEENFWCVVNLNTQTRWDGEDVPRI